MQAVSPGSAEGHNAESASSRSGDYMETERRRRDGWRAESSSEQTEDRHSRRTGFQNTEQYKFRSAREEAGNMKINGKNFTTEMTHWYYANIDKNVCLCGCGALVQPSHWRWYNGKSLDYATGHNRNSHRSGNENNRWSGGKLTKVSGYTLILSPDHPNRDSKGYVLEHRLVMENVLGRYLNKSEVVHHINGIKIDNRPENLCILTSSEHMKIHSKKSSHPNWVNVSIDEIRQMKDSGISRTAIARKLGVSTQTVTRRLLDLEIT